MNQSGRQYCESWGLDPGEGVTKRVKSGQAACQRLAR